eukprot:SAG31_NODE_31445_length_368_cov_0.765799_1_plen_86_part_01
MAPDVATVTLLEDGDGRVHIKGVQELSAHSAAELQAILRRAQGRRASAVTGVHDASSRSHLLCRMILRNDDGMEIGRFDLADLAGS